MFNLAEILTLLIGCLLALVFIDGIRRALRIRKSKLKVDLIDLSSEVSLDFEEEWKQGFEENEDSEELSEPMHEEPDLDIQPQPQTNLNIIHLNDNENFSFSESTLSQALVFYNFTIEDKGFFTVLDSKNLANPFEAVALFVEVSQSLQETFQCNILDEDRNLMTKQMIEHMKHEFHERQRQLLASAS